MKLKSLLTAFLAVLGGCQLPPPETAPTTEIRVVYVYEYPRYSINHHRPYYDPYPARFTYGRAIVRTMYPPRKHEVPRVEQRRPNPIPRLDHKQRNGKPRKD